MSTRLLLHASSAEALIRARNNAQNYLKAEPEAQIEIITNASAVPAALENPHPTDELLYLCGNTLDKLQLQPTQANQKVVAAAIVYLVQKQKEGWIYIHA